MQDISLAKEGVTEDKLQKKWTDSINRRRKKSKALGGYLNPLIEIPSKLRQFSLQFIRCFRANFMANALWEHCVPQFKRAMATYL